MPRLTHVDERGQARMVDVASKPVSVRTARATGVVETAAAEHIAAGSVPKGDVIAVARVAGIMAAKRTPDLVPLCHPIALHSVAVDLEVDSATGRVSIEARVTTADRTGVEMEALTAVAVAGLTVIDMVKAVDPLATITDIRVEEKAGGKSGSWHR
ncbi:MAG: cyclic pyranopterin monophosphate synthase MoaC [Candidatus Nanopelagicales bacterium]|nr:cyclic pyranopterin monophosphate synthase MoaC [Candidatus Nanopelagicales bacterium]